MGQQSDVSAHAFSLGFGTLLGLGAGATLDRRRGTVLAGGDAPGPGGRSGWWIWAQRGLALVILAAVAAAWRRAWSS
jgi:hypothetical protein